MISVSVGPPLDMPAIYWADGSIWFEASVYLRRMAFEALSKGGSQETVEGHASALKHFSEFIEERKLLWTDFPVDRSLRPTYLYRGYLVSAIESRALRKSTAARYNASARMLYQWVIANDILEIAQDPFRTKVVRVGFANDVGFMKQKDVVTTDLAIRVPRNAANKAPEDGVFPIQIDLRDKLLRICRDNFRVEFNLVLKLGFYSGMRIGTIVNLTFERLLKRYPSRELPGWYSIDVGPSFGIPTKLGVDYHPSIPGPLVADLIDYCKRPRRALRLGHAATEDKGLVFLNRDGARLTKSSFSADMTKLRRLATAAGLKVSDFHFHCSRATFASAFVMAEMDRGTPTQMIVQRLMALLGHARPDTSMLYVQFVEDLIQRSKDADDYSSYLKLPESPE